MRYGAGRTAAAKAGHRRIPGGYVKRTLPRLDFEYTEPEVQAKVEDVDAASLENLPSGVDEVQK